MADLPSQSHQDQPAVASDISFFSHAAEDEMILCAVRAVYENHEGELFREMLLERIEEQNQKMVRSVKRNSRRVESGIGNLLTVQQSVTEMEEKLVLSIQEAKQLNSNVDSKSKLLAENLIACSNIASALDAVHVLKRVIKLYREANKCVNNSEYRVALKLVGLMQSEVQRGLGLDISGPDSIQKLELENIIPNPAVIENAVARKCDSLLNAWTAHVASVYIQVGKYAVSNAASSNLPWVPEITITDETLGKREDPFRNVSQQRSASTALGQGKPGASSSSSAVGAATAAAATAHAAAPEIDARMFIQCYLLNEDLGRKEQFRTVYFNILQVFIDSACQARDGEMGFEDVSHMIYSIVGLFVVEKCLAFQVISDWINEDQFSQLWDVAQARLVDVLHIQLKSLGAVAKSRLRGLIRDACACLKANRFSMSQLKDVT